MRSRCDSEIPDKFSLTWRCWGEETETSTAIKSINE